MKYLTGIKDDIIGDWFRELLAVSELDFRFRGNDILGGFTLIPSQECSQIISRPDSSYSSHPHSPYSSHPRAGGDPVRKTFNFDGDCHFIKSPMTHGK